MLDIFMPNAYLSNLTSLCLIFLCKDELTDLKLVIGDTIDNVATLQDCSMDEGESLQLLGERRMQLSDCVLT